MVRMTLAAVAAVLAGCPTNANRRQRNRMGSGALGTRMSKNPLLAEQELEIMKVVWDLGSPTVREVYEVLRGRRRVAYTTIMTMMNILAEKKLLKRTPQGRAYIYRATRPKNDTVKSMVRDFVGRVFDGSAKPLLVQLVEDEQLTEKDLQQMQDIIRKKS